MPLELIPRLHWTELVLNRPPRNVLDEEMLTALLAALAELTAGRAPLLLLRAEGKHFSTGYAIGDIPEAIFHRDPAVRANSLFEQVMKAFTDYPSPVVAAVHGDAFGGAVELLACTDLRVAAARVRLAVPSVRLGLVYSHTGLRRLLRGFGSPLAREMLLTGSTVDAERSGSCGFFHRVVAAGEVMSAAEALLGDMAKGGPQALKGTLRVLNLLEEKESLDEDSLAEIALLRHESWSGEEFRRAQEAFLKGKKSGL